MWRDVGEEHEAFVERVRAAIAAELGVPLGACCAKLRLVRLMPVRLQAD